VPCAEGKIVEATDPRSAAQRKEARRIAELEHQRAAELERERLAAERAAKPSAAVGLSGQPAPAASGAGDGAKHDAKKGKGAKSDAAERDFVATVPGEKRKSR
jgi:hypothetical protein